MQRPFGHRTQAAYAGYAEAVCPYDDPGEGEGTGRTEQCLEIVQNNGGADKATLAQPVGGGLERLRPCGSRHAHLPPDRGDRKGLHPL